ncbi:Protein of unknown function [Friedmanniella luteola]|uniref:DUF4245 domain-containing protein n=1 Tax=Friedmanniella luteola TaxID=546871 RepID=A0A1H1NCR1_9ACTN|nr:DUF4245 domain-containing protein [Friedmanniella luteola]SDR96159.1 Protein of unknown function [Friedmanniella luteola]
MARASSRTASTGDMVRSLLVLLIPVIVITYFFTRTPAEPPVRTLDWTPVLAQARDQAPFPVLAPRAVPPSWRATQVTWVPEGRSYLNGDPSPRNLWQLGFLDASNTYVELAQGDLEPRALVEDKTREGLPDGTSDVAGTTWERRISEDERTRSLVLGGADVTTVVVGDLPYGELESFASTLTTG